MKKILPLLLAVILIFQSSTVYAAEYIEKTTYRVSTLAEADEAILASLNVHASKMVLSLGKNLDYNDTYDLIVPYTRGIGTYNTHNFGYVVNGGTWTSLEINVRYYTSINEEILLDQMIDNLVLSWSGKSDYEKIKAAHDYICEVTKYSDNTANQVPGYNYRSAYDALVYHESVCSGYALLFQKIMERMNISSYVYIDDNDIAHAWNIVCLDDKWYQIDCTWDDQPKGYNYDYFLKGKKMEGHEYTGDIKLSDTEYKLK